MADISRGLSLIEQRLAEVRPDETEAKAAGSGVAVSRYVAGLTDEALLRAELQALGYTGERADNLVLQANLRRELELYKDRLALWAKQHQEGTLSISEYATLLEGAGVPPSMVTLAIQRAQSQAPRAVVRSVQTTLSILSGQVPAPEPVERPVQTTLTIIAAQAAEEAGAGERPVAVSLSVLEAEAVPASSPPRPVQVTLTLLEVEE